MKRMAFVVALVAMAGCSKGEQKPAASADTASMMMSDTSHMKMSDSTHMMTSDTKMSESMSDSSRMSAAPAGASAPNPASVELGAKVYKDKGCAACHNIAKAGEKPHRRPGGKQAGPDLGGITDRRDHDWLARWLKDPDAMRASDPAAQAMVREAKGLKMPNMTLTDTQIEALIAYLSVKQ